MSVAHPILPYQDNPSAALAWLLRQDKSFLDMTEAVYRQEASLLRTRSDGVLLRHRVSGGYLIGCDSPQALEALAAEIPDRSAPLTVHLTAGSEALSRCFPGRCFEARTLWYLPEMTAPAFTQDFEIWPLDEGDLPDVLRCDPAVPAGPLREQIQRRRVFGACIRDELAGTVGTDPAGGIAWLAVRPDLRGQGIGRTLLRWMLRQELRQAHVPYLLLPERDTGITGLLRGSGLLPAEGHILHAGQAN